MLGLRKAGFFAGCQAANAPMSTITTLNIRPKSRKRSALWQTQGLYPGKRSPTELMFRHALGRIFPSEKIIFKARKALNMKRNNGDYLEIDASIPHLKFHAEYQDPYHFSSAVFYSSRPLAEIKDADAFKKRYLTERGETLLQLPCWWDGTDDSLIATIKLMRPDLLQHLNPSRPPVSETEPDNFLLYHVVPDVGQLMRPLVFSEKYYNRSGEWLANEKLDGVRCCWNPKRQMLYSRHGKELRFPNEWKQHMPGVFVDGEVWFGRGQFHEAAKLSKRRKANVNWAELRVSMFDIPSTDGKQMTYGERYKTLHSVIPHDHPFLFVPAVILISHEKQLLDLERVIGKMDGEGVILTEKQSLYEPGYTTKVLKVKPSLDKEALVISGDNEYLTLKLTDGTRFRTRAPNIRPPPRVGDVITFTYHRCVQGSTLPDNPKILRVRSDITWSEVLSSASEVVPQHKRDSGSDYSIRWNTKLDDLRGHFINFAKDNNFDPLIPENWYNFRRSDILAIPGAYNMLKEFKGSVTNALVTAFNDIQFDKLKFNSVPRRYWTKAQNIRKWFDEFAKQNEFDPLVAQNWYSIKYRDIVAKKGASRMLHYFNRSHIDALVAAYPGIGIEKSMFSTMPRGYWQDTQITKKWFDEFAKEKGFDPSVAQNWYTVKQRDIVSKKGGSGMLQHFNKSYIHALVAAYPTISIDKSMFSNTPVGHWKDVQNVRNWLIEFANSKSFDPLNAHNWVNVKRSDMNIFKGGRGILRAFKSFASAIDLAFPEHTNTKNG